VLGQTFAGGAAVVGLILKATAEVTWAPQAGRDEVRT